MRKSRKKKTWRKNKWFWKGAPLWLFLILGMALYGINAAGMEMGGFTISMGEGEGENPPKWEEDSFEADWEENDTEDVFAEPDIPENDSQNWDSEATQWDGEEEVAWEEESNQGEESEWADSAGSQKPLENAVPDSLPVQENTVPENMPAQKNDADTKSSAEEISSDTGRESPSKQNSSVSPDAVSSQKAPAAKSASAFKSASASKDASTAKRISPSESNPISKRTSAKQSASVSKKDSTSEASVLTFYKHHSEEEREKKELLIHYQKEKTAACARPGFFITGTGRMQILSVRINGAECLWHWEDYALILDGKVCKESNCIEMVALYEEGEAIQVQFQREIS